MEAKGIFLSLGAVLESLEASPFSRNFVEGQRVLNAKHVILCEASKKTDMVISIYALCLQTSALNSVPHTIEITFKIEANNVIQVGKKTCTCKSGSGGQCKHIAAVLLHCSRNDMSEFNLLSQTDKKCLWNEKKGPSLSKYAPLPLLETPCFLNSSVSKKTNLPAGNIDTLVNLFPNSALAKHRLGRSSTSGVQEQSTSQLSVPDNVCVVYDGELEFLKILLCEENNKEMEYVNKIDIGPIYDCCNEFYNENVIVTDPLNICILTKANKNKWMKERQFRITGSRCYEIFTYQKDNWTLKASKYFWPKSYGKIASLEYGIAHEGAARECYKIVTGNHVKETGLIVSLQNPWLAYSPDGIILEDGKPYKLLELKCTLKGKEMSVNEAAVNCSFLNNVNGKFVLKRKHKYYAQVQLGMAILNLTETDFVLYASKDNSIIVMEIKKDDEFISNMLSKLKMNYFCNMLHVACSV